MTKYTSYKNKRYIYIKTIMLIWATLLSPTFSNFCIIQVKNNIFNYIYNFGDGFGTKVTLGRGSDTQRRLREDRGDTADLEESGWTQTLQ